jgi:hypothetical protein
MSRQAKRKHEDISSNDYTVCIESADKLAGACRAIVGFKLLGNGIEGDEDELCVAEFPENFIRGHQNSFKIDEPKVKHHFSNLLPLHFFL